MLLNPAGSFAQDTGEPKPASGQSSQAAAGQANPFEHINFGLTTNELVMTWLALILSIAAFVYLVYAMLRPEKF